MEMGGSYKLETYFIIVIIFSYISGSRDLIEKEKSWGISLFLMEVTIEKTRLFSSNMHFEWIILASLFASLILFFSSE